MTSCLRDSRTLTRLIPAAALLLALTTACQIIRGPERPVPLPPGSTPQQVVDPDYQPDEWYDPLEGNELILLGKEVRKNLLDKQKQSKAKLKEGGYHVLVLSGGGALGAYPAGVLCGWSQCPLPPGKGGRPEFDVVTGISTGALIAPLAFLGKDFDGELQKQYTTVRKSDIYVPRRSIRSYLTDSYSDNTPLRRRVEAFVSYENMARVAEEHRKGRRLYVGTTNLDTKRLVVWDIGAIAQKCTPEARKLIVDTLIASSAIPAFFPPQFFDVTIDGVPYNELHVDGGVTRSMFFRPPIIKLPDTMGEVNRNNAAMLAGSNVYAMVAGKIYHTPAGVRARTLPIVFASVTNLLYAVTRADLYRLYTYALLTGMNFWVSAIPQDLDVSDDATAFDPVSMGKMFCEGYRLGKEGTAYRKGTKKNEAGEVEQTLEGTAWKDTPPGLGPKDELRPRTGTRLVVEREPPPPTPPANPAAETKGPNGGAKTP